MSIAKTVAQHPEHDGWVAVTSDVFHSLGGFLQPQSGICRPLLRAADLLNKVGKPFRSGRTTVIGDILSVADHLHVCIGACDQGSCIRTHHVLELRSCGPTLNGRIQQKNNVAGGRGFADFVIGHCRCCPFGAVVIHRGGQGLCGGCGALAVLGEHLQWKQADKHRHCHNDGNNAFHLLSHDTFLLLLSFFLLYNMYSADPHSGLSFCASLYFSLRFPTA